jgi:type VI secretion system protein ImpK
MNGSDDDWHKTRVLENQRRNRPLPPPSPSASPLGGTDPFQPRPFPPAPAPNDPALPSKAPFNAHSHDIFDKKSEVKSVAAPIQTPFSLPRVDLAHANPIIKAANRLLIMISRLSSNLEQGSFTDLNARFRREVSDFNNKIIEAGVDPEHREIALYSVCALVDDTMQNLTQQGERYPWAQNSMCVAFCREAVAGQRFFDYVQHTRADPALYTNLIELQFACLALGFQGVYRTAHGGGTALQDVRHRLHQALYRVRTIPAFPGGLSPHWEGVDLPAKGAPLRIPFWVVTTLAALILFGYFIVLRTLLSGGADEASDRLGTLFPQGSVLISRVEERPFSPPPPPPLPPREDPQIACLKKRLAQDLTNKNIDLLPSSQGPILRIVQLASFAPGQASVIPSFAPLAQRLATALEKEPGKIKVIGHTDSTPVTTLRFKDNQQLSEERAKTVKTFLAKGLSDASRLEVKGMAEKDPVISNAKNPDELQRNRRVDIHIAYNAAASCE